MNLIERVSKISLVWILALAFMLRIAAFLIVGDPHFPDSEIYIQAGRELFSSGRMTNHIYMPLYPILTFLAGGRIGTIFMDIVFSTATVGIISLIGQHLSGSRMIGRIAAIMAAIYPFFIYYSFTVLTESSFIFFVTLTFLLYYERRYVSGAAVAAASLLIKPVGEPFFPILIVLFSLLIHRETFRNTTKNLAIYVGFYLLFITPWWIHNYQKFDQRFVRLTLADGIVLYSGNNPMNQTGGGVVRQDGTADMDLSKFASIADPIEQNQAMKSEAIAYIRENPSRFVEMAGKKFVRFWRLWPYADQFAGLKYVVISLISYGSVLVFAVAGVFGLNHDEKRRLLPVFAFIAFLTAVHCVTIGSIRYRLPLEPFLIVLAAFAIARSSAKLGRHPDAHPS